MASIMDADYPSEYVHPGHEVPDVRYTPLGDGPPLLAQYTLIHPTWTIYILYNILLIMQYYQYRTQNLCVACADFGLLVHCASF
jgi:hypothetical protein